MDTYVSVGGVIGRVQDTLAVSGVVTYVLIHADETITTVPVTSCTIVQVCELCHAAPKQHAVDGNGVDSIISDLCDTHQHAKEQRGTPAFTATALYDSAAERRAAVEAAEQEQPVTQAQFSELVQLMRQLQPPDASAKAVE